MSSPLTSSLQFIHFVLFYERTLFIWTTDHDTAFNAVKRAFASLPVHAAYDPTAETALMTDASRKNGLGYALLQNELGKWKLVRCRSRFVSDNVRAGVASRTMCYAKMPLVLDGIAKLHFNRGLPAVDYLMM